MQDPILLVASGPGGCGSAFSRDLAREGFETWDAASAATALKLASHGPDLIIVDLELPDGSGLEVCAEIKRNAATAAIPILLSLDATDSTLPSRLTEDNPLVEAVVLCPATGRQVAVLIRQVLRRKELEKALLDSEARYRQLVGSIGAICRMAADTSPLKKERIDLAALVEHTAGRCRPLLNRARQKLALMLLDAPLWAEVDGARIEQAIELLLGNAVASSPIGSQIWLTLESVGSDVILQIRDTGRGFSADALDRVFEPPSVEAASLVGPEGQDLAPEPAVDGFGTGLFAVRNVVELHGGLVSATSEGIGRGAEITIRLPMAVEGASPADVRETSARRVLIVEDNANVAATLSTLVGRWGYQVIAAPDGPTALNLALTHRPDVVLLDIGLPGMSGYDVAAELKNNPETSRARIVAVTGYGQQEDQARAFLSGFDSHVTKPVEPRALRRVLTNILTEPDLASERVG